MQRTQYTVLLEDEAGTKEHTIDIRNVDRLQAEVSGRQNGILAGIEEAPMTWTTHWLWHACKRLGIYDGDWRSFKTALVDFEDASEGDEVPPTNEAELTSSVSS